MKNLLVMGALVSSMLLAGGCRDRAAVDSYDVIVGENTVTAQVSLSDSFALDLEGSFPVNLKGNNYGEVFIAKKNDVDNFRIGLVADFSIFTSDTWDGFEPTTTLPNGDPIPGWIYPYELIRADIPNFSDRFDLNIYGGYYNPYYIGTSVSLNFLDEYYPEGLQIFQNFRKDGQIWGTVALYGPTTDSNGDIVEPGGIFFVLSVSAFRAGESVSLEAGEIMFEGPEAHKYENDTSAQRELFRNLQRGVKEFNASQKNVDLK